MKIEQKRRYGKSILRFLSSFTSISTTFTTILLLLYKCRNTTNYIITFMISAITVVQVHIQNTDVELLLLCTVDYTTNMDVLI